MQVIIWTEKENKTYDQYISQYTFGKKWQIQYPFMRNTFFKVGMVKNFLNLIKCIDRKPTANVILNNENACYPPKSTSNSSKLTVSIKACMEYPNQ